MGKETDEKAADEIHYERTIRKRNALEYTLEESADQIAGYRTDKASDAYDEEFHYVIV